MGPRAKRKTARKSRLSQDASDYDLAESSPSRPATKRRKVNGRAGAAVRRKTPSSELDNQDGDETNDESELVSHTDLIDLVVSCLTVSKEFVVATRDYANDKQQDDTQKVSAYAKIAGRDWTYFVREQSVNLGRPPDDRQAQTNGVAASSPMQDMKEMLPVHIDLGPSKIVSRHHASIFYDAEFPDEGGWHVRVNGRNGVRVNNVLLKRGSRQQIASGTVLEISGTQMMFMTPSDPVQIDQYFINHAKRMTGGEEAAGPVEGSSLATDPIGPPTYQSLAPAPAEFKQERASTPPAQHMDMRTQRSVFDTKTTMSPMYGRGMMMESTQEIDYSRDSAKDLKPPFSYATMIAQAIFSSDEEKMTLANIYQFISDRYAFYRHSNSGWQNSIRHNLSLNKAFQKVPRRTDEPGKGMKWMIAPEHRQEYWKKQAKRNGGSAPSSPASSKEVNPNFRGPNGQNLGYDTTMVTSFSAKDSGPPPPGGNKLNFQPPPISHAAPHLAPVPNLAPPHRPQQETVTPQRRRTDTGATLPESTLDDSPLPTRSRPTPHPNGPPMYTLPSSVPPPHRSPTNPTLSSSYLDTPFHHSQHSSIITPAPMRQNPRLAPPSTLVAPSKFMPESSPAGPGLFWKGMMGVTPGQAVPDLSPVKVEDDDRGSHTRGLDSEADRQVMSSSPPPIDAMGSPSKPARGSQAGFTSSSARKERERDLEGRSRSASATVSAPNARAGSVGTPVPGHGGGPSPIGFNANANAHVNNNNGINRAVSLQKEDTHNAVDDDDDDDDAEGGFDLAKGFAPIARGMGHQGTGRRFGV